MRANRSASPISFFYLRIFTCLDTVITNQFIRTAAYLKFALVTFIYSVDLIQL